MPTTHLAFLGNGQNYHVQKWLPALAEQDLRVTLLTFHPPSEPVEGVAVRALTPPVARWRGGRLSWLDFWGSPAVLRATLEEIGADVLVASYATHYGLMGARSGFRPLIAQTWTFDVTHYPFVGWKRHVLGRVVRRVLGQADVITTDGEALAEIVRARYPSVREKVVGVRWGIRLADYEATREVRDAARQRWQLPAEAPVVVSARGIDRVYQPEVVLPGLRQLLETHPDVHVIVLTLGHDRSAGAQAGLEALAVHPRARVVDRFLSKDEMRSVWAASDVLISVPSQDGISEGVLEGMYAGALPVVSDIPSNRSFLEDDRNAFYVPAPAAEALAQTLHRVLSGLEAYQARMVPANRRWVAEHASVEGTARQVADMVRSLHTSYPSVAYQEAS